MKTEDNNDLSEGWWKSDPKEVRAERKEFYNKLKAGPCTDCKRHYPPYVMDFDHVRGKKVKSVSILVYGDLNKLVAEVAKCDLVCANCHRIRTHNRHRRHLAATESPANG